MENRYSQSWDNYVKQWVSDLENRTDFDAKLARDQGREKLTWPGDEWGREKDWLATIETLLIPAGMPSWNKVVEIGQGSGKYTIPILENKACQVKCFDVSQEFINVCKKRCLPFIQDERLELHCLETERPRMIQDVVGDAGWTRKLDAMVSIDAMVHVDLNNLAAYFLAASELLRYEGKLVMTLADVSSDAGFEKLLRDLTYTYTTAGQANCQFEWLHPTLLQDLLPRFGFKIELCKTEWRDIQLIASLVDLDKGEKLQKLAHATE